EVRVLVVGGYGEMDHHGLPSVSHQFKLGPSLFKALEGSYAVQPVHRAVPR
ncbi:hypothetical protein chiPu_0025429, partial [Chiloscyllium punctatum]|nr:hypothetical protein [Chiloscyllium punctatum]